MQWTSYSIIPGHPSSLTKMFPELGAFKTVFSSDFLSQRGKTVKSFFFVFFTIFKQDAVDGLFQHIFAHLK